MALKQNSRDINHILTGSLVVGFIYCNFCYLIPISISKTVDDILIVVSGIIVAYIFGRMATNDKLFFIFEKLKIRNTFNTYLWDDLMDMDSSMRCVIVYDTKTYEGYIHYIESYSNSPHIALCLYTVKNEKDDILENYTDDATVSIVLDTSKANSIQIQYDENSKKTDEISMFKDKKEQDS